MDLVEFFDIDQVVEYALLLDNTSKADGKTGQLVWRVFKGKGKNGNVVGVLLARERKRSRVQSVGRLCGKLNRIAERIVVGAVPLPGYFAVEGTQAHSLGGGWICDYIDSAVWPPKAASRASPLSSSNHRDDDGTGRLRLYRRGPEQDGKARIPKSHNNHPLLRVRFWNGCLVDGISVITHFAAQPYPNADGHSQENNSEREASCERGCLQRIQPSTK